MVAVEFARCYQHLRTTKQIAVAVVATPVSYHGVKRDFHRDGLRKGAFFMNGTLQVDSLGRPGTTRPPEAEAGEGQGRPLANYEVSGPPVSNPKNKRRSKYARRNVAQKRAKADMMRARAQAHADGLQITAENGCKLPRTYWCGHRQKNGDYVDVRLNSETKHAHVAGIQYCGAVWACPTCSSIIRSARAKEIEEAASIWKGRGNGMYFMTLTVRHHQGDDLAFMLACLSSAWSDVISGNPWRRIKKRYRIVGFVRTLEITYGSNGWHPHLHFGLFVEGQATEEMANFLRLEVLDRWKSKVEKHGGKVPNEHGIDVQPVNDDAECVARYIGKIIEGKNLAQEIARGDAKESDEVASIVPFQFLDYDTPEYEHLWRVYVKATKGRRSVYFSRGLRDLLGMNAAKTDEQIIEELESTGKIAAAIDGDLYEEVIAPRPETLADVLEFIEAGRLEDVQCLLGCDMVDGTRLDSRTGLFVKCALFVRLE